jgi:phosphohistidine phosphatase
MKVCLLRHAEAEPRGAGVTDAERQLTHDGKRDLRTLLKVAHEAGVKPEVILTSPWSRALETAKAAGEVLDCENLIETKALLPDVLPANVWGEVRSLRPLKEIMLVGHEPHMSRLASFLLEAPLAIDFKKAGLLRIEVQDKEGPPRGVLKWMLTPKLARGLKLDRGK